MLVVGWWLVVAGWWGGPGLPPQIFDALKKTTKTKFACGGGSLISFIDNYSGRSVHHKIRHRAFRHARACSSHCLAAEMSHVVLFKGPTVSRSVLLALLA